MKHVGHYIHTVKCLHTVILEIFFDNVKTFLCTFIFILIILSIKSTIYTRVCMLWHCIFCYPVKVGSFISGTYVFQDYVLQPLNLQPNYKQTHESPLGLLISLGPSYKQLLIQLGRNTFQVCAMCYVLALHGFFINMSLMCTKRHGVHLSKTQPNQSV